MESYIKLFELMEYNDNNTMKQFVPRTWNHKNIEKALSKNYSLYKFYT